MNLLVTRQRFLDKFYCGFPFGYSITPLHGDPLIAPERMKIDVKSHEKSFTRNARAQQGRH